MLIILYVIIDYFIIPLNDLAFAIVRILYILEKTAPKLYNPLFTALLERLANIQRVITLVCLNSEQCYCMLAAIYDTCVVDVD
jgi:hypothetical protein